METLEKLLIKDQQLLAAVSKNRSAAKKLVSKNGQIQEKLKEVRAEIVEIVTKEMATGKSLYQVVKESLGKIDGRYNKIYDLVQKKDGK